jgi:voltage-gated potassium channel
MKKAVSLLGWVLSPTRKIIDKLKVGDSAHCGRELRKWNWRWFLWEVTLAVILVTFSVNYQSAQANWYFFFPLLAVGWSRINEIAYAFYQDPLSRLANEIPFSDLLPIDRIRMAMKSYVGLGINFAIIFYFLPLKDGFTGDMSTFFDALYFSGVTLTTLGYGDIAPKNCIARAFALYEVFAGILLIAVAIGTYIGASSTKQNEAA